jgi:hypothetical protein
MDMVREEDRRANIVKPPSLYGCGLVRQRTEPMISHYPLAQWRYDRVHGASVAARCRYQLCDVRTSEGRSDEPRTPGVIISKTPPNHA